MQLDCASDPLFGIGWMLTTTYGVVQGGARPNSGLPT